MSLDSDVRAVSAFEGWADLERSMREHDYVPTLHPESPEAVRVRRSIHNMGFRVFPWSYEVRVNVTFRQRMLLLDLGFPGAEVEPTTVKQTYIVAPSTAWESVLSVLIELDPEDFNWIGWAETYAEHSFAVRNVERCIESLESRIVDALEAPCAI